MKARAVIALFFAFACSVTLLTTSAAYAQMSEGERKAAARAAYGEGIALQDQGKPAEALAKFEAAQKLYDAPTHLLHIAETQAVLGKLVEASETYESMIRRPLPPGSPEVFVQAQEQARKEAPALRERIPSLKVTLTPDPSSLQNLVIAVNDRRMPNELVGIARPVNPGAYRLSATANGWATRTPVDVELKEKDDKVVELVLQQGGGGAVVAPVPPPYGNGAAPADPNAPPGEPADSKPAPPQPPKSGLLVGGHAGYFAPGGSAGPNATGGDEDFDRYGTPGGGLGIDLFARFSRVFLVGGRLEGIFLGGPNARHFASNQTVTSTTTMFGGAVLIGLLTSTEKVGFYSDFGLGYRQLNYAQTSDPKLDVSFNGTYFTLGAGVSIPAGPIRIVPKLGIDFGSLSPNEASISSGGVTRSVADIDGPSTSYTMLFAGLNVFYNIDFGKKPAATAGIGPAPTRQ